MLVRGLERFVTEEDGPGSGRAAPPAPSRTCFGSAQAAGGARGAAMLSAALRAARRDHHSPPTHQHAEHAGAGAHMPVTAARLADVLARHMRPAMTAGSSSISSIRRRLCLLALARSASSQWPRRRCSTRSSRNVSSSPSVSSRGPPSRLGRGRTQVEALARPRRGKRPTDSSSSRAIWSSSVRRAARSSGLVRGAAGAKRSGDGAQPPIGALGFEPQKICVPTIPTRWTITVFSTIDFAVAVPTPTGPPLAV